MQTDRKQVKRINELIKDAARNPYSEIGKPGPLRHALTGLSSRRASEERRIVYRVAGSNLEIAQLRFHYAK